jgi:hypothetical protein
VYDQSGVPRAQGYKHWIERKDQLPERKVIRSFIKVYPERGKKMDMEACRKSLQNHDDGK